MQYGSFYAFFLGYPCYHFQCSTMLEKYQNMPMESCAPTSCHNCSVVLWNCNEMLTDHSQQTHPLPQEKDGSKNWSLHLQEIYLECAGALLWHSERVLGGMTWKTQPSTPLKILGPPLNHSKLHAYLTSIIHGFVSTTTSAVLKRHQHTPYSPPKVQTTKICCVYFLTLCCWTQWLFLP